MRLGLALLGTLAPSVLATGVHTGFVGTPIAGSVSRSSARSSAQQQVAATAAVRAMEGSSIWGVSRRQQQQLLWATSSPDAEAEEGES